MGVIIKYLVGIRILPLFCYCMLCISSLGWLFSLKKFIANFNTQTQRLNTRLWSTCRPHLQPHCIIGLQGPYPLPAPHRSCFQPLYGETCRRKAHPTRLVGRLPLVFLHCQHRFRLSPVCAQSTTQKNRRQNQPND